MGSKYTTLIVFAAISALVLGLTLTVTQQNVVAINHHIQQNSQGHAVIVTGDFNQLYNNHGESINEFLQHNSLNHFEQNIPEHHH